VEFSSVFIYNELMPFMPCMLPASHTVTYLNILLPQISKAFHLQKGAKQNHPLTTGNIYWTLHAKQQSK